MDTAWIVKVEISTARGKGAGWRYGGRRAPPVGIRKYFNAVTQEARARAEVRRDDKVPLPQATTDTTDSVTAHSEENRPTQTNPRMSATHPNRIELHPSQALVVRPFGTPQ
jgi:hypothetical protein